MLEMVRSGVEDRLRRERVKIRKRWMGWKLRV
jgi:hypothetical protein